MPRPKDNPVYKFFNIRNTLNISECKVGDCKAVVKGRPHAGNLQAHLHRHHPEIETQINKELEVERSSQQAKITDFVSVQKEEYVMVKFSRRDVERSALTLITSDGRPFSSVEDQGYKVIVDRIVSQWNKQYPKKKFSVNRHNVSKLVKHEAQDIINTIKTEVRGKMVCVKIDCAARFDRSFLGINIQYRNESGTLKVYTVGIVETFQDHTGEYLLEELKNTLLKFDIELSQIYSVTIDNGANMVKMCRLLNEYLSSKTCSYDESVDDTADPSSSTHGRNEEEDEEYFLAGIEEHEVTAFYEHQERVVESMEIHLTIDDVVPIIRCAAHTLQLAIFDTLKNEKKPINKVIEKVRKVAIKLRTPKNRKKLRSVGAKAPIIANATRWSSTCLMLRRFSLLRPKIEQLSGQGMLDLDKINYSEINKNDWIRMKQALRALEICKSATTRLQKEDLTLNDFFTIWTSCQFKISQLKSKFAKRLEKNMKKRQKKLLDENIPLLSSLLLDPRYKNVLSGSLVTKAMEHIQNLYEKIVAIAEKSSQKSEPEIEQGPSTSKSSFSQFLEKSMGKEENRGIVRNVHQELCDFLAESFPVDINAEDERENFDVWNDFWVKYKFKYPQLFQVTNILFSVPATQTTVERLFSHLHFILSDLRCNLRGDNIEDILLVRWNNKQ